MKGPKRCELGTLPGTLGVAGEQKGGGDARSHRYQTMCVASVDVKTAFDVARLGTVQGDGSAWLLLEEMKDQEGKASFESCETEFSRCIRQGSVEAPILGMKLARYIAHRGGKVESSWSGTVAWRRRGQRVPDQQHCVGRQLLHHE